MGKIVLFFTIFLIAFTPAVQALEWDYSFVVWDGNVYEVKKEKVSEKGIGKNIGEVKTRANDITGDYYGDASNAYPIGTKYYKIKDVSTNTAIAVKVEENEWQKAVFVHDVPFHWKDLFTKLLPIFLLISIIIIIVFRFIKRESSPCVRNKRENHNIHVFLN